MVFDAIIVGSGPAGTFASYALRGRNVLVLDVGYRAPASPTIEGNLYSLRQTRKDLFDAFIGERFEGLRNMFGKPVSLKLKAPRMSYVIQNWEQLSPVDSRNFDAVMSFAAGGLANAWGAGVFRFTARDLAGFPVTAAELEPFYDELTEHIGVCGANDDLTPYFGEDPRLLPPLRMSAMAAGLLAGYRRKRSSFRDGGLAMGLSRLAVLTREHNGRAPYGYENLEFFRPYNPAIYNPVFTLDSLVAKGEVTFADGYLVTSYQEHPSHIDVLAKNLRTGITERFAARNLLLGAGTLSSTKIVLESNADTGAKLPILDNPMSGIPIFSLGRVGRPLDTADSSLAQLTAILDHPSVPAPVQASLYGMTGPLRSDVIFELPLSVSANLAWAKYVSPAMMVWLVFYPGLPDSSNYVRLTAKGSLEVNYEWHGYGEAERRLVRAFRSMGCLSSTLLCRYTPMGSSLHYAGTLPMKAEPGPYETDKEGRLSGTERVYVCDGACFTGLPAKNLTFTIMANAMRIAAKIRRRLE